MTFKNWIKSEFSHSTKIGAILELSEKKDLIRIGGSFGSANLFLLSVLQKKINKSILYLCSSEEEAKNALLDLESFGAERAFYFPSFGTTAYQSSIVEESIRSQRLEVLKNLLSEKECIVTASVESALFHITPKEALSPFVTNIKLNDIIDIPDLAKKLVQSGYIRVAKVMSVGEFSIRGDIVDIYYSIYKNPARIDFFDNKVESIKLFDPSTQKSEDELENIIIPPHKEFVYGEKEIKKAKKVLYGLTGDIEIKDEIFEKVSNFMGFDGEQYYLDLFYKKSSLMEYFENGFLVVNDHKSIKKKESILYKDFEENYHLTVNRNKPRIIPEKMLFALEDIYSSTKKIIEINYFEDVKKPYDVLLDFKGIPVYLGNLEQFKKDVSKYIDDGYKIILFANTEIQKERLQGIYKEFDPSDSVFDLKKKGLSIFPLFLSSGFISKEKKIFFLNDYEIFGKRKNVSHHFYTKRTEVIESFIDLKQGDYVVHMNHGIGQFMGIERVESQGNSKDYISILYADDDKVFIPIEQLNFIQKYISQEFSKPRLDKIGSKGWSRTKERVKRSIEELAKELIKLYSFRLAQKGFAFSPDTAWQKEFEAKFVFEETEDQLLTLEEVKRDMESSKSMDRLICGDVGFGKTEIAIRAAFKAVMSGKQALILVPTTILAEQHFETFSERLKDYPINVEMLSRFRSTKDQIAIIKKVKAGDIDIIIGTHRLLSKDIEFKNPGLYIVDEEQRFGVKHKEKLKQIRKTIDCLSLTATPIPRTLHMSLSSIRNISIINTPPKERQSVETYVMEFNEEILIGAVNRELERNGQIFFLYNRIKTIQVMKNYLEKLVPNARIIIAHGRLGEEELEDVIHSFIRHEYDILLTTTIIESGIDMPRVNTIFIDRADKFGLAQLYQLKGRVGRSIQKAYAYLFHDSEVALTEDAMKRLRVISEYTELGSGFKIAMKDLEIRGAGNLLGPEQSGDILAVGFQLYCKLLTEAISELAPEETKELKSDQSEVYLDLEYTGFIPDGYIADQKQKMEFYKKIAGITYIEEMEEIKRSLIDRFGPLPNEVKTLFYLSEIRILCKKLKISEMKEKNNKIEIIFTESSDINVEGLMNVIRGSNGSVYLSGKAKNSLFIKLSEDLSLKEKGEYIREVLTKINDIVDL